MSYKAQLRRKRLLEEQARAKARPVVETGLDGQGRLRSPSRHRAVTLAAFGVTTAKVPAMSILDKFGFKRCLGELGFQTYRDYLHSPLWFTIRNKVLKRAHHRCSCGARALQVHHEIYTRENLTGENLEGLAATCDDCHRSEHFSRQD